MFLPYLYDDSTHDFLAKSSNEIMGEIATKNNFNLDHTQKQAWEVQIQILKDALNWSGLQGRIYFEFSIPRLGKRIDVVLIIHQIVFILEFKVGESVFPAYAVEQVWDYALDLKNFHKTSQNCLIAPILIATHCTKAPKNQRITIRSDRLFDPLLSNADSLSQIMIDLLNYEGGDDIDSAHWVRGSYHPTPTIIEAAKSLYANHTVAEITRKDATAESLKQTSSKINNIIEWSKAHSKKTICFVTGVPGAGKTLIGLQTAIENTDKDRTLHSVFLSGNGPLVDILREALVIDKVNRVKESGLKLRKADAKSEVKMFIQNVHHFRDDCLYDLTKAPVEHVAIFDEAQRAWNREQTIKFMTSKRGLSEFHHSEPEFLISCLNRHSDWAVIVCLVGGGQEIHTGEVGISEWIASILRSYQDWNIFVSPELAGREYATAEVLKDLKDFPNKEYLDELHLKVSMRSFRAENLSALVKAMLDLDLQGARIHYLSLKDNYPIRLTRNLNHAKNWLKQQSRGSERFGIVASSKAQRLKPYAIDVKAKIDPVQWFLKDRTDVRSSYYLEDAATEFQVQGLELDWTCVTWDGDFRKANNGWSHWSFVGDKWNRIHKLEIQKYQLNAYRVLLTRARQGMIIFIPEGDPDDPTRESSYYDGTYQYLAEIGIETI